MSVISYKCPNCGGELVFDPKTQKLQCEYCLSSFDENELETLNQQNTYHTTEQEIVENASDSVYYDIPEGGTHLYTCPSCGAQIVTDATTSATTCWYCHNPIAFSKQLTNEFKPSKIIPFQKSKEEALDTFKAWCKKKHFLPNDFCSPRQMENIAGLYVPYWLVDSDTHGVLRGSGKKITSWVSGDYRYTKTDVYTISRAADMSFKFVPHDASKKADDQVMKSIEPFQLNALKDFSYSYLSGFLAEKYDVTSDEIYPTVKKQIEMAVSAELHSSIKGYTSTSFAHNDVNFKHTCFHYALMPVWMLTYTYQGKTYLYAMNGQTGKTFGSMPLSTSKLNRFTFIVFIIAFIIILTSLLFVGGITI